MSFWGYLPDLQQQKLQKHTSPQANLEWLPRIYNSRNYRSILAALLLRAKATRSTIVEIIEAYQPFVCIKGIWRIYNSRNYRSILAIHAMPEALPYLQQQKLQKHTSRIYQLLTTYNIYNSRNYRSILAPEGVKLLLFIYNSRNYRSILALMYVVFGTMLSTIVEIIEAYQPLIDCKDTKNPLNKGIFCISF